MWSRTKDSFESTPTSSPRHDQTVGRDALAAPPVTRFAVACRNLNEVELGHRTFHWRYDSCRLPLLLPYHQVRSTRLIQGSLFFLFSLALKNFRRRTCDFSSLAFVFSTCTNAGAQASERNGENREASGWGPRRAGVDPCANILRTGIALRHARRCCDWLPWGC